VARDDQALRNRLAELNAAMDKLDVDRDRVRRDRDKAIRRAHKAGMTSREIARISGISHQRVHQIITDSR
jgi:DNA invertase Pin-like site-specific DNA recombinase